MKYLIVCLCLVLSFQDALGVIGRVWEFMLDAPGSELIYAMIGDKSANVKVVRTKLDVSDCYNITYVKVVIDNPDFIPLVKFDETAKTVQMTYNPYENKVNFESRFAVYVKGLETEACHELDHKNDPYPHRGLSYAILAPSSYDMPATYVRYPY